MIYTVECSYADAASEAEWNAFYSEHKLPALISVGGFHTSQRLRALTPGCPTYLALHSLDGLAVLQGEEYRRKGGGNFARWQPHITDWHRCLYEGVARVPAIGEGDHLLVSRVGVQPLLSLGVVPDTLQAVALDRVPAALSWAVVRGPLPAALHALPGGVHLYAPMTPQLTPLAGEGAAHA